VNRTDRDSYWGAKLVGSFTDEQIRAAVDAGELPSQFAADTLAAMLSYRRDRIVEYWYGRVSPVENPEMQADASSGEGFGLAFDDYGIRDGAWPAAGVKYTWKLRHDALGRRREGSAAAGEGPRQFLAIEPAAGDPVESNRVLSEEEAIATLEITVGGRNGMGGRPAIVYLEWDTDAGRYRVLGLEH